MTAASVRYCTAVDDTDRAKLQAATKAVDEATTPADRRAARAARAELVHTIGVRLRAGRYPNRWNPAVRDIAEATGMHRTQVSRIVNGTPVVRAARTDEQ